MVFFQVIAPSTSLAFAESAYSVGPGQNYVTSGDLNNDGDLDLVVANSHENVYVMLGNGDGTFQPAMTFATGGTSPIALALADFNNDGTLDAALVASIGVSVLLGNGDGTFQPHKIYTVTKSAKAIAIGDFNADSALDIAVLSYEGSVIVLTGNGKGAFGPGTAFPAGTSATSIITGDFNRDGRLDLITNSGSGTLLLPGNGDGSFQPPTLISSVTGVLATADLNGDGILDVVAVSGGSVSVLLGNGDGTFQAAVAYPAAEDLISVVTGDFNGDGKIDLALADAGNGKAGGITILLGNGDGSFQPPAQTPTLGSPSSLAAGDFNGDGRLDPVFTQAAAPSGKREVSVALQTTASISPAGLAFTPILVGKSSKPQTLSVTNIGSATLNISTVSLAGGSAGDFATGSDTCQGASVPPSGTCTVEVTFLPSAPGTISATLSISDNAPASPQNVTLAGTGTVVALVPAAIQFGQVKVGTISQQQVIEVTNTSTATIGINGIMVTGRHAGDFLESTTCGTSLKPKASCNIVVQFIPTRKGTRAAAVAVGGNPLANPMSVLLSGEGI